MSLDGWYPLIDLDLFKIPSCSVMIITGTIGNGAPLGAVHTDCHVSRKN